MASKSRRKPTRAKSLGVTDEEYTVMFIAQDGKCAICHRPPKEGGRRFHVDHDHRTERIRGLLCFRCNRALPTYVDAVWLRRAAYYLDKHSTAERARLEAVL